MIANLSHDELNGLQFVFGPQVDSESEHFFVCDHCGQAVDYRRLGDVRFEPTSAWQVMVGRTLRAGEEPDKPSDHHNRQCSYFDREPAREARVGRAW